MKHQNNEQYFLLTSVFLWLGGRECEKTEDEESSLYMVFAFSYKNHIFPTNFLLLSLWNAIYHKYCADFITDSHRKFTPCSIAYLILASFFSVLFTYENSNMHIFGGSVSALFVDLKSLWVDHGEVYF